jgi:hypothetical protein
MYDYAAYTIGLDLKVGIEDLTADQVAATLNAIIAGAITKVTPQLETYNGGRWEIMSHDLMRLQSHLVLSFLLRRLKI